MRQLKNNYLRMKMELIMAVLNRDNKADLVVTE